MLELNNENFEKEISEKLALVVFWSPGCGACSQIFPFLKELEQEIQFIGTLNILENHEIAQKYRVPAVPTLIIFKNGQVKERAVGLRPKKVLVDKINELKKSD
jgi:thioredoxin 1